MAVTVREGMNLFFGFKDYRNYWVALSENSEVMGILSFSESSYRPGTMAHTMTDVHPDFQHQGVATALWSAFLAQMKEEGREVSNTPYEPMGLLYLEPVITRLAKEMQVTVFER